MLYMPKVSCELISSLIWFLKAGTKFRLLQFLWGFKLICIVLYMPKVTIRMCIHSYIVRLQV